MWQELTPESSNENHLQKLFDHWGQTGCRHAGVPSWLGEFEGSNTRATRAAFGYEFTTDVEYLIPPRHYIIELKRAAKYEPLALAEVLHHTEWVRRHGGGTDEVVPVIVSSFNSWLRHAIAALPQRTDGFGALRYYEVDFFERSGDEIVWFDEPLATWEPADRPAFLHGQPASARLCWHYVPTTRSWVGTERPVPDRPVMLEMPYVMVAELDGGDFLLWEGVPAPNHTRKAGEMTSRYFVWSTQPRTGASPAPIQPTWLDGLR